MQSLSIVCALFAVLLVRKAHAASFPELPPMGQFVANSDLRAFDDSILYDIEWTNEYTKDQFSDIHMVSDTVEKFFYECAIPRLQDNTTQSTAKDYTGLTPMQLLNKLFKQPACSFRAESYWTYEVCHGDFIKQYHEERDGKTVKVQNYMLGWWNAQRNADLEQRLAEAERRGDQVPVLKIESLTLPYVELNMTDGSPCDLVANRPRQTRVLYVCYPHGQNEVFSLKEVSTCQYEVIILTQVLCEHPSYKPLSAGELTIKCAPKLKDWPIYPPTAWKPTETIEKVKFNMESLEALVDMSNNLFKRFMDGTKCPKNRFLTLTADGMPKDKIEIQYCHLKDVTSHIVHQPDSLETIATFHLEDHAAYVKSLNKQPVVQKSTADTPSSVTYAFRSTDAKCGGPEDFFHVRLVCYVKTSSDKVFLEEIAPCQNRLTVETALACMLIDQVHESDGLTDAQRKILH